MKTILSITVLAHHKCFWEVSAEGWLVGAVVVPEPYQAGDDPSAYFFRTYAEGAELIQYGQQPRG